MKSLWERIITSAIRWYNIGVTDGRRWEAEANQGQDEVVEIDEYGNVGGKRGKPNILRDPEGEC